MRRAWWPAALVGLIAAGPVSAQISKTSFWLGADEPALDTTTTGKGWLTAVDAATGQVRWRYRSDSPMLAAVTTTSAGVLFTAKLPGTS
jgi:outer membrane protein assembly factor BamB